MSAGALTPEWPRQKLASFPFYEKCLGPVLPGEREGRAPMLPTASAAVGRFAGEKEGEGIPDEEEVRRGLTAGLNLEGEIRLNLKYGGDFSLKRGSVPGAGSKGVTDGLAYDLFEKVILTGNVQERLFVEFDYDSRRTQEGLAEEHNTYSVLYKGRENEFLKEASLGNKYQSIEGSRYVPIDQGNPNSFAVRGVAGWKNLALEGLFRYEEALEGRKRFQGFRKSVDLSVPDVSYVRGQLFMLPDTGVDEISLRLYSSVAQPADIVAGGRNFKLLTRGVDFDFDNSSGFVFLKEALSLAAELIVYYTKGGAAVGDAALGRNAIIGENGVRTDFDSGAFPGYFVSAGSFTCLYLKKEAFNSYWELRNAYALPELEGQTVSDVSIELLYTENGGANGNYDALIGNFTIDAPRAIVRFEFNDGSGRFYPRPFPGPDPYDSTAAPFPLEPTPPDRRNPFDPRNPIYGGINYPTAGASINTLRIKYRYEATSFFLDFNLVPGSVTVTVNGAVLDPSKYDVDSAMGVVTFDTGVIGPTSDIVISYKYTPFGGGDKRLFGALGLSYEAGPFRVKNLSAFRTGLPGREAPEAGTELPREFKNTTEFGLTFEKKEDRKLYGSLSGGFAFSLSNRNAFGSAIVADMERDEALYEFGMDDETWTLASISSILPGAGHGLADRGDVLYKNYWKKTVLEGDVLQGLSYPDPRVFAYADKAGPYSVDEEFQEADDRALVIDYELPAGSVNAFVSVVTPVPRENLSGYERFNMILQWQGVSNTDMELYVELLGSYNEDLNANSRIDGESSINDPGFAIAPAGGNPTRIGSDRDGKSNGRLDSEDLNRNNVLDTAETGVLIPLDPNGAGDFYAIPVGSQTWRYLSVDVNALIAASTANRNVFQLASALRITVRAASPVVPGPGSAVGKVVIDKVWFSGSGIFNESPDILSISDVSVDEDPEVRQNAFSKSFPGVYEELHGTARYRSRIEYLEKVLKVRFDSTPSFSGEATVARRFGAPADLSFYREFKMYLYRPASASIPAGLDFVLRFVSSQNETLTTSPPIQSGSLSTGWNEVSVALKPPYAVRLNGAVVANLIKSGTLEVLRRVSRVQFGFTGSTVVVPSEFTIWLDEWHVSGSEGDFDKAYFAEGSVGYAGAAVSLGGFPLVRDPVIGAGLERREGNFMDNPEFRSDRYSTDMGALLFNVLDSRLSLSGERLAHFRNRETLPAGLDTDGAVGTVSHDFVLDFKKPYLPVLVHGYDRTMKRSGAIELTQTSYRFKREESFSDAVELGERYDLPFGLTHFYTFQRRWQQSATVTRLPPLFDIPAGTKTATLNQVNDIHFSYGWERGTASLALKRDETFTGTGVPDPGAWPDSYFDKMARVFAAPGNALEGAAISLRKDRIALEVNRPPAERAGVSVSIATEFVAGNFQPASGARDVLCTSTLSAAVPFRPAGSGGVELVPSLSRAFSADYKRAGRGVTEREVVLATFGPLFSPPFAFARRQNEYEAVDLYSGDARIEGTSSNTLETRSSLDARVETPEWYVPSKIGTALYGKTSRQGETYAQLRGFSSSASKSLPLAPAGKAYNKNLTLAVAYKNERDFAAKTVLNAYTLDTALSLLAREWRGAKLSHSFTYERERQRLSHPDYYAFPQYDAPAASVAFKPFRDKIESTLTLDYLWSFGIGRESVLRKIWRSEPFEGSAKNTERVVLENSYTFTDRERAGSYSNLPLRLTLEHVTSYGISEHVEIGVSLKGVGGVEERVLPESPEGNILVSAGLEAGVTVKIVF